MHKCLLHKIKIENYYAPACSDWALENSTAGFNDNIGKLCFNCKYCKKAH